MKSLEAKVDSLIEKNNNTCGDRNVILKSLATKMESLTGMSNNTITSFVNDALKFLEVKVEDLIGKNDSTSGVADAMKSLEAKVESLYLAWKTRPLALAMP